MVPVVPAATTPDQRGALGAADGAGKVALIARAGWSTGELRGAKSAYPLAEFLKFTGRGSIGALQVRLGCA